METEPTEMKLREKYLIAAPFKFGGKKRRNSNEGRTGRVHRRTKRCVTPGCHNSKKRR